MGLSLSLSWYLEGETLSQSCISVCLPPSLPVSTVALPPLSTPVPGEEAGGAKERGEEEVGEEERRECLCD